MFPYQSEETGETFYHFAKFSTQEGNLLTKLAENFYEEIFFFSTFWYATIF